MRDAFLGLAESVFTQLVGDEICLLYLRGESSDFVRFNRGRVRQAGTVDEANVALTLIRGKRSAQGRFNLSGDNTVNLATATAMLARLRGQIPCLPEDPHLSFATDCCNSEQVDGNPPPPPEEVVQQIVGWSPRADLVGIYAGGAIHRGFANSLGQRNWFTCHSFHFDWSLHAGQASAVKHSYAGTQWDAGRLAGELEGTASQLALMQRSEQTLKPGAYRVYLAPSALYELLQLLGWGGFSLKAHRTKQTPLLRMVEEGVRLSPALTLSDNYSLGTVPRFQEYGFVRPDRVPLIENGGYGECLVSPRSAEEYGVRTNGAAAGEAPTVLDMAAGDVEEAQVLEALEDGLYINNLWYLNYSDHRQCRITGMTRFGTFRVRNGKVVGPANTLRFDESLYRCLGDQLLGLTRQRHWLMDADTYGGRGTDGALLPGALVNDFRFTL